MGHSMCGNPTARALEDEIAKNRKATSPLYEDDLRRNTEMFGPFTSQEVAYVRRVATQASLIKAACKEVLKARGDARILRKGDSSSGGLPAGVGPTFAPAEPLDFVGSMLDLAAKPSEGMFEAGTQSGITFKLNGSNAAEVSLNILAVADTLNTQGFSVPAAVLKRAIVSAITAKKAR